VEMPGLWKAWKAKSRLPLFPRALGNLAKRPARFSHFHSSGDEADGKVENQSRFPTFPPPRMYMDLRKKTGRGRASPSARRRALRAA